MLAKKEVIFSLKNLVSRLIRKLQSVMYYSVATTSEDIPNTLNKQPSIIRKSKKSAEKARQKKGGDKKLATAVLGSSINYYVSLCERRLPEVCVVHIPKFPISRSSKKIAAQRGARGEKNIINERTEGKFDNNFCNLFRYLRLR